MAELKVPRYQQVIETLTAEIRAGKYEIGEKIATEAEQVERFKVSRITIRKAMEYLEQEGYISREIGRGTFVRSFGSTAAKDKPGGMVAFLLVGVSAENDYNYQEIITTERFLSERGIPFSWAALTQEDLIRGRYPTVIEKRMCAGLILDGHVNDAHMALAEQFGVKIVAVGNHNISAHLPQVRSRIRKAFKSILADLLSQCQRRVLIAIEPMVMHLSHEMLEVYAQVVAEIGQDEQLVYLCPDDQPPLSLQNIIEKSGDDLIVLTTDIIFRKLTAIPDPRPIGNRPNFIVLGSFPVDQTIPKAHQIAPRARAMQLLAAERLLDLIEGRATSVYEELDCDIIQPA